MKAKIAKKIKRSTVNRPLIEKIILEMEKEPRRINMRTWTSLKDFSTPCRTSGCIAGFAVAIQNKRKGFSWREAVTSARKKLFPEYDYHSEATEALGLTERQASRLFFANGWPQKFRKAFDSAKDRLAEGKVVIARLRHFLKTGK